MKMTESALIMTHPFWLDFIHKNVTLLQFTWLDGDGSSITEGITSDTEEIENTKRITAISTLKLTVKKSHHNKNVTCQAQNPAESSPNSVSIKLLVEYAPHVTINVDNSPIKEFQPVTFTCNAHANPKDMSYRWIKDVKSAETMLKIACF